MPFPSKSPRLRSAVVPLDARAALHPGTTAAFAVAVPFAALLWLFAMPGTMSVVMSVALALVAMGAALVAVNTWRNGQATGHLGHVLNAPKRGVRAGEVTPVVRSKKRI